MKTNSNLKKWKPIKSLACSLVWLKKHAIYFINEILIGRKFLQNPIDSNKLLIVAIAVVKMLRIYYIYSRTCWLRRQELK